MKISEEFKLMSEQEKLAKRRLKFSKEARQQILGDHLNNQALLSRSQSPDETIKRLQRDHQAREELLDNIEAKEIHNAPSDQIEHGLRKLREIIVGAGDANRRDPSFVQFACRVYQKSVLFYCRRQEVTKCYQVLNFFVESLAPYAPSQLAKEMSACYAIYMSHVDNNISGFFEVLNRIELNSQYSQVCIALSLIYCVQDQSLSTWFRIVSEIPPHSLLRDFILALPAFGLLKSRTLGTLSKCYNQLSVAFIKQYWFHDLYTELEPELEQKWNIETTKSNARIVMFKFPKSR
ncbi:LAQU0S07e03664g1_1 [Lachancea quebecensis]|uniref:LAQU0S07e03664g1_1 n=1 Tax=Lachancea quebecensis TaxID=1654605 RepID=A0A0P1KSK0_9SACH|nr:LAQU0S07e03664g1_1 [Lachancea quebecensis]